MKKLIFLFCSVFPFTIFSQSQQMADSCFNVANEFFQNGDYESAGFNFFKSAQFEKSSINPRYEDIYFELTNAALCYKAVNDIERSKQIYIELIHYFDSLQITQNTISPRIELASLYLYEKDINKTLEPLNSAILLAKRNNSRTDLMNCYLVYTEYYLEILNKKMFFNYVDSVRENISDTSYDKHYILNHNIADFYKLSGYSDSTEYFLKQCIHWNQKAGLQIELADILLEYAQFICKQKPENAIKSLDSSIMLFNNSKEFNGLATALNTKGTILSNNPNKNDAIQCFNSAIKIFTDINNAKGIASVLINMADLTKNMGNYNDALDYLYKAYDIYLKENDIELSNVALSNIGHIYITQSKFDKAIEIFEKTLKSSVKEKSFLQAVLFNNIGSVYNAWGQYDKALEFYKKSLDIHKFNNNLEEYAVTLNNIGNIHEQNGQNDIAIEKYKEALSIFKKLHKNDKISIILNNIGGIYYENLKPDEALMYYNEALSISEETNNLTNIALLNDNIGNIYLYNDNLEKARMCHEKALLIRKQLGEMSGIASSLNNLAVTLIHEEKYNDAINYLTESVNILESLRIAAKEDARKDYLNNQIFAYQNLVVSLIKTGDFNKAFYYNELSRSKQLAEQIAKNDHVQIPDLTEVQNSINDQTAILIFATVDNTDISTFLITKSSINVTTKNKEQIIRKLLTDNDIREIVISRLTMQEIEILNQFINNPNSTFQLKLSNKIFSNIIKAYSTLLNSTTYKDVVKTKKLSNTIYNFLIAQNEQNFAGKNKILIMQDGILGYLPFETLLNNKGQYLISNFDISYTNSFSVRKLIKNRIYPADRLQMITFGVSQYDKKSETPQQNFALNLTDLKNDIYKAIALNKPMQEYYYRIGYTGFNDLKESITEVKTIAGMFSNSQYYTDSACAEFKIKKLSQSGILKKYKYIHFSTHGISVPEIPELSSLILFKTNSVNSDDGYLQMGEIAKLELNADFVNLSACETGLGKIYSGEGVVGLTQAFISAGANKISVSLWQVDESSTAEFMKYFYEKAISNNFDFSKAINDVKREFIAGEHGIAWRLPYFWAPFIVYGD